MSGLVATKFCATVGVIKDSFAERRLAGTALGRRTELIHISGSVGSRGPGYATCTSVIPVSIHVRATQPIHVSLTCARVTRCHVPFPPGTCHVTHARAITCKGDQQHGRSYYAQLATVSHYKHVLMNLNLFHGTPVPYATLQGGALDR